MNSGFPALHGRASLKHSDCDGKTLRDKRFSRPSRAGLIEAFTSAAAYWPDSGCFPALHGRASLKRLRAAGLVPHVQEFSRPSRAGLIEASATRSGYEWGYCRFPALHGRASLKRVGFDGGMWAHGRRFPALHGRASLKRGDARPLGRRGRGFPALHGRASLKRAGGVVGRAGVGEFSRPSRAGLIEAATTPRSSTPNTAFSRPSRAGLIEALGPVHGVDGAGGFPALHGRASLKHGGFRACSPRRKKFSRPSRAGLIEARRAGRVAAAGAGVFPPFTGGPH